MIIDTLQTDDYPILFVDDVDLADLLPLIEQYSSIFILVDENTKKYCLTSLSSLDFEYYLIEIQSGEKNKNINTCQYIWKALLDNHADRNALMINLGGGVIGDMGGFCASTYMRGIDFIQMPTTLLSQVDASVGGKLGVDFHGRKNIIGLFCHPQAVIVRAKFLTTLPKEELRSGFAEVIKHALINDADLWSTLHEVVDISTIDWNGIIAKNIEIKNNIVSQDFKEGGIRKILNYGHTIGHGVESFFLDTDGHLLHGEAVAIGMICENYIAMQQGLLDEKPMQLINKKIKSFYPDLYRILNDKAQVLSYMRNDKKNKAGEFMFSILTDIGECAYDICVNESEIIDALDYYQTIYNK